MIHQQSELFSGYKSPNGIPFEYLLCESKRDVYHWLMSSGYGRVFPKDYIPFLVELEWVRLQEIRKGDPCYKLCQTFEDLKV